MDHKQFVCDNLQDYSPHSGQSFQADRFVKKTAQLNIPDTIPENSSAEFSGESLKMEAPEVIKEVFNDEEKDNISLNQSVTCNDSLNTSTIAAIDSSYIKQCERKLLESSNSEDEKNIENKFIVDKHFLDIPRMSAYQNDTISTPPSLLRREISLLRNEMAEAHEFHDFEIQLLKEEKFQREADSYNYSEVISKMTEKYSALMDLYTNLKVEYEDYRNKQEHMRQEIQSKTADCLESLCSQIEASDNSLNFSTASFASFNGGIKSSTMMEDITEVEATILHDATVLANDPLSITNEGVFKTPLQTPLKSAKKLFPQESVVKDVKDIIANRDVTIPFDSEYHIQLLNVETALSDKIKEVEDLEQRLFKVEDLSSVLQTEVERVTAQNNTLKESLSKKTEQLNELTQKLFTETISLKPSLRDSLIDISETKLLFVFIETIMESCRKIQMEEIAKHNNEKSEWEAKIKADTTTIENLKTELSSKLSEINDLEKKLSDTENLILIRDEEILMLQSQISNVRKTREDFASARETLLELESRLTLTEAEKTAAENRYRELETLLDNLKRELEVNKDNQKKLEVENFEMKNEIESQNALKSELMTVKEKLSSAEEALEKLKSQIESEKAECENHCAELQDFRIENDTLKQRILETEKTSAELKKLVLELQNIQQSLESEKLELENRCAELQNFQIENENLKKGIVETQKASEELKSQLKSLESEKAELENRYTELENIRTENERVKKQILEVEKTSEELKSQLESLESEKVELENRCTELQNFRLENENLKERIMQTEKTSDELKSQLKSLESEKAELENRYTELENIQIENERVKKQILEMEKTSEELKSQIESLESEKAELEERCAELQNFRIDNENLKVRTLEIEKASEELKFQLRSLESEKAELENRCTEFENIRIENEKVKKQILEVEKTSEELKSQLQSFESKKLDVENRCTELENNRTELKFKLESLESEKLELENYCTEYENIQIENKTLKERIFEIEKTSKELKSNIQSLECEKLELENHCTEFENIRMENENLKQQISEIRKTKEELRSQLNILESEKSELENRYTELQNIQKEIKSQLESLKKEKLELVNIRTENDTLKQQIFEIENASEELKSQLQSLESEKQEMENRCVELQNILTQNDNLKQQIFESEKLELENRCTELESIRIENSNLKQKIFETEKASAEFKYQLQSLKSEKVEMENRCLELENFRVENDTLKQRILESEKASAELKTELDLRREDEIKSKNKIEDLFREIEQLKKQNSEIVNAVEETQNKLTDLMSGYENNSVLPSERITKLVENSKFQETKIVSVLIQTIGKTCEGVQNELLRNFDSEKLEWETHLQVLHKQIDALTESRDEKEAKIVEINLEKEDLLKSQESLKNRITEAEKIISEGSVEMKALKETAEAMLELKSQLSLALSKKEEMEIRCRELEEENQLKIKAIMKDLEEKERELADAVKVIADQEEEIKILREQQEKMKNRQQELEEVVEKLKQEIEMKEDLKIELTTKKSEIIHLKESYNILKAQMTEAENAITTREEEIRVLKTYKTELSTIKENLASADETILQLKSQLKSIEVEKSQMENRCTELENNKNYEKIQTENDDLKERIFQSDKMLTELKNELEIAKEDQKNNMTKVEELIREIEELKRENDGFSNALVTIEETQRNLADVLSEDANDSDLPGDRITKLIAKTSKPETKIVSDFVETITKTCKGVQNEMIKKFDSKKLEWDVDLRNLHEQIKTLTEANNQQEAVLCQTKNELILADERIGELKSQLTSAEIEKAEAVESLKIEIDTKETIIKGLDEMKNLREKVENENCFLRQQLQESEDLVICLKKRLTTAEEDRNMKEKKMQELVKEIDLHKKEMDFISQKLEKVEKSNRNLMEVVSDVQIQLNIPDDNLTNCESRKIFSEKLNEFVKAKMEGLETENKNLKLGNENLKEEIKKLTKLIGETASNELKDHLASVNTSHSNRTKSGKNIDLCVRRLDKLEEINLNLTELLTRILTMMEFPDLEKLKLCSVREFPSVMKKVVAHVNGLLAKMKEMKEENGQLDEECETYANIIKDLKKEAAAVWKDNKEKTEAMEAELEMLKKEKNALEKENEDLAGKILKLNEECLKLKSKTEGTHHICTCGNESKKINELKRAILVKEQKLLELQDLEAQTNSYKSQIEYLKTALEREKKKIGEEKEKNKKLQNELKEAKKQQITDEKKPDENQVLDELRMRGSISGGIVQDFVDKEKMRKLSKDIGILKELCRARYAEIKRLEAVNAALRNGTPKNSNQMDSPIRSRGYNTRSKNQVRDFWKTEISGKENSAM